MADEMKNVSEKVRYSDEELQEFKAIIIDMLEKASRDSTGLGALEEGLISS